MADGTVLHVVPTPEPTRPVAGSPVAFTPPTLEELAGQVGSLQTEVAGVQSRISGFSATMNNLGQVINNTENSVNTLGTQVAQSSAELTQLTAQVAQGSAALTQLTAQVQQISATVTGLDTFVSNFVARFNTHTHVVQSSLAFGTLEGVPYSIPVLGTGGFGIAAPGPGPAGPNNQLVDAFITEPPKTP